MVVRIIVGVILLFVGAWLVYEAWLAQLPAMYEPQSFSTDAILGKALDWTIKGSVAIIGAVLLGSGVNAKSKSAPSF